jgi:hypothetical protein
MPMLQTAIREREREQDLPSNASNEQLGRSVASVSPAESESEDLDRRECNDQGMATERPTEILRECQRSISDPLVLTPSSRREKPGSRGHWGYCHS